MKKNVMMPAVPLVIFLLSFFVPSAPGEGISAGAKVVPSRAAGVRGDSFGPASALPVKMKSDADVSTSAARGAVYLEYRAVPGMIVPYPDYFDKLDPSVFQSLVPSAISEKRNMKLIFFALNSAGGEPKLMIARSEYKKDANLAAIIKDIDNDIGYVGGIQDTETIEMKDNFAVTETSAITHDGDIFKTMSKIFLVKPPDKKYAVVYQVGIGASFNNYYKYFQTIDYVIHNTRFDNGGK